MREMAENDPGLFCYMDQYSNPENWKAHYDTTAPEIWRQSGGSITHFIAGLGTSGTFVGTVRRLKELNPQLQAVSVQPDSPFNGLEGLKHMATAIVPAIYDPELADRNVEVETEAAYAMVEAARARSRAAGGSVGCGRCRCLRANREARGCGRTAGDHRHSVTGFGGQISERALLEEA